MRYAAGNLPWDTLSEFLYRSVLSFFTELTRMYTLEYKTRYRAFEKVNLGGVALSPTVLRPPPTAPKYSLAARRGIPADASQWG
jgi:hypothetical protein